MRVFPFVLNESRTQRFINHTSQPFMNTRQDAGADKVGHALNAQRFQMLEDIARELAGEVLFPTDFDAALHLHKKLQQPDLPTARVAQIVGMEPLIAAKLMNLANSVRYNRNSPPARDLLAAISRLGIDLVRTTALAIAMGQLRRSKEMAEFGELTHILWDHTVQTAAAARILARTQTQINPDEALLAGLVHDLGAFYMLYRAAQYPELRCRPDSVKYLILNWHESIGVSLLGVLGLPDEIVNATIDHDQLRKAPAAVRTLSDIVHVANILAGTSFELLHQGIDPKAAELEIVRHQFSELQAEIKADTQEMMAVFA